MINRGYLQNFPFKTTFFKRVKTAYGRRPDSNPLSNINRSNNAQTKSSIKNMSKAMIETSFQIFFLLILNAINIIIKIL